MTKLQELSLAQLKEKAIKAGMPKETIDVFNSKKQLIAVIEGMKGKVKLVDQTKSGDETPKEKRVADKNWESKRDTMARLLEEQPKVSMQIPLDPKEEQGVVESKVVKGIRIFKIISGAVIPKTINGYTWFIPKGIMTQVPEQIYELVSRNLNVIAQGGREHQLDRKDPNTGKTVRDALS